MVATLAAAYSEADEPGVPLASMAPWIAVPIGIAGTCQESNLLLLLIANL